MRTRLFAASAAALTVFALGVSAGPSSAQTPSTVFVGVVTVTSPPVVPAPPTPIPQVTGPRRTSSCRMYNRGHGKGRHPTKRMCRKRHVSAVPTRRTVQTMSVPQPPPFVAPPPPPTFVVPSPLSTFVVAPPPPTFVVAPPPPVIVVTLAVAPVVKKDDHGSDDAKHDKKRKAHGGGKEKEKSKGKGRVHDD